MSILSYWSFNFYPPVSSGSLPSYKQLLHRLYWFPSSFYSSLLFLLFTVHFPRIGYPNHERSLLSTSLSLLPELSNEIVSVFWFPLPSPHPHLYEHIGYNPPSHSNHEIMKSSSSVTFMRSKHKVYPTFSLSSLLLRLISCFYGSSASNKFFLVWRHLCLLP